MNDAPAGVFEMLKMCGGFGWLAVLLGLLGVALGIAAVAVALTAANKRVGLVVGGVAFVVGTFAASSGVVGNVRGNAVVEEALRSAGASGLVDASQLARIRDEGRREAGMCLPIGAVSGSPAILLGLAASAAAFVLGRGKNEGDARPGA
ncbi:MAG: hypothetical protein U0169_04225 [Polyangiaceae bacterium]